MKLINLTLKSNANQTIYVNIEQIGYLIDRHQGTEIATNSGSFTVHNDIEEVIDLINESIQNNNNSLTI